MNGIEVRSLSKSYGQAQILHDVTFSCVPGQITGLLGPNGSGKTTIMRLLTGLGTPDSGVALFDGMPYHDIRTPGRDIGVLLDAAAHHSGRTVFETVRIAGILVGVDAARVREVIEIMGLASVVKRRFGALSLGMRQRVGLAIAFLGRPRFLILDEPVNGLDVESIRWLRDVLVRFCQEDGGTVLISSHLLQELQSYADRVVIVDRGRIVVDDDLSSLRTSRVCDVVSTDPDRLKAVLADEQISFRELVGDRRLVVQADGATIGRLAMEHHILVSELVPGGTRALENLYFSVTSGEFATDQEAAPFR